MQRAVSRSVDRWNMVYDELESGRGFASPSEMISELGLRGMLESDGRSWLADCCVRGRFVDEYASPVGRIMYGQDVSMHAFATSIALAGAGLAGNLFSVAGGNHRVCQGLLDRASVALNTGSQVIQENFGISLPETEFSKYSVPAYQGFGDFNLLGRQGKLL